MRALSFAFGLVMVAAGAVQGDRPALVVAAVALGAVVVGLAIRAAATVAVLATVVALALSSPTPVVAALAGLAATVYLVLRHADGPDALAAPTAVGALGLSAVAIIATTVSPALPWVPLAAPLAAVAVYVLVVAPLLSRTPDGRPGERPLR